MKLQQEGKLTIESPINDFLPFQIIQPYFPGSIIRIRHLVTHTSGIVDIENNYDGRCFCHTKDTHLDDSRLGAEELEYIALFKKNKKLSLKKYLKKTFSEKGKWYAESSFSEHPFGTNYEYSNVAAGLLAYLVERVSGTPYDEYIEDNIFKELEMQETTFEEKEVNPQLLVKSYITDSLVATPYLGFINYPDGGIHTSCEERST